MFADSPQTFSIPGVKEHAHFLKDVKDARAIRSRILECTYSTDLNLCRKLIYICHAGFEQANQPILDDVERQGLLNFCLVGMLAVQVRHCLC